MRNIRKPLATHRARGLTLVEMLMATALTLIMFAAVAQIFGMMGGAMQDARATIELSGNLRSVTNHLQRDLDNLTVEVKPWVQPGSNQGYFEIIEGPDRDVDFAAVDVIPDTTDLNGAMGGDADDILCFTAYSKDEPFVGLIQGSLEINTDPDVPHKYWINRSSSGFTTITSQYAEIVYFTKLTPSDNRNLYEWSDVNGTVPGLRDANETVTLYRRVFLIRPDILLGNPADSTSDYTEYYELTSEEVRNYYDLSVSFPQPDPDNPSPPNPNRQWKTNSLEDLQLRQNRVAHRLVHNNAFPYALRPQALLSFEQLDAAISGNLRDRTGEDVILTRTLAFDVKVFDPGVAVKTDLDGTIAIQPSDSIYTNNTADLALVEGLSAANMMTGAFVDLNWTAGGRAEVPTPSTGRPVPYFAAPPALGSSLDNVTVATFSQMPSRLMPPGTTAPDPTLTYAYYDTWPFAYEITGVDRNGDGIPDNTTSPGTNGFDDNGDGVVDDIGEYETSPPYPVPLRGISITVRAIEDGTRQVRQDTIMADFLPK